MILILLNDSVQLLNQNLERFQRAGMDPSPKKFTEILDENINLAGAQWVIFCKKNPKDLQKLVKKLEGIIERIVIDDEADYATPNSKINKTGEEKSKINSLTRELIGEDGHYIGVTATPARLDLNSTHNNKSENWVDFPPHSEYHGQEIFFPLDDNELPYGLKLLSDDYDNLSCLEEALFSFMVNVAHLNSEINEKEENYSFLIHTSGKKADHAADYETIINIFEALNHEDNDSHKIYYEKIWSMARERYPGEENEIVRYILENKDRNNIVVMNSDQEKNAANNKSATTPSSLFTIIIGGNIVSRGVTFDNLLSMFFTRDVKNNF